MRVMSVQLDFISKGLTEASTTINSTKHQIYNIIYKPDGDSSASLMALESTSSSKKVAKEDTSLARVTGKLRVEK
jgi:hypothetical protein